MGDGGPAGALAVELAGFTWRNPVTVASGIYVPWGNDLRDLPLDCLGAVTCKSVSTDPWPGNAKPWFADLGAVGFLNSIGIRNPGVDAYLREHLDELVALGPPLIQSLAATRRDDFCALAERMEATGAFAALELNLSCPNTDAAQRAFGQTSEAAYDVMRAVRAATGLPLIAKLGIDGADVVEVARACAEAGAAALTLINTVRAMEIDVEREHPVTGLATAGLSGAALRPVALRVVWEVHAAVDLPIIGAGGIADAQDALRFLLAGATAVAVGTAAIRNQAVLREVVDGLAAHCAAHGIRVRDLVGRAHRPGRGQDTSPAGAGR